MFCITLKLCIINITCAYFISPFSPSLSLPPTLSYRKLYTVDSLLVAFFSLSSFSLVFFPHYTKICTGCCQVNECALLNLSIAQNFNRNNTKKPFASTILFVCIFFIELNELFKYLILFRYDFYMSLFFLLFGSKLNHIISWKTDRGKIKSSNWTTYSNINRKEVILNFNNFDGWCRRFKKSCQRTVRIFILLAFLGHSYEFETRSCWWPICCELMYFTFIKLYVLWCANQWIKNWQKYFHRMLRFKKRNTCTILDEKTTGVPNIDSIVRIFLFVLVQAFEFS